MVVEYGGRFFERLVIKILVGLAALIADYVHLTISWKSCLLFVEEDVLMIGVVVIRSISGVGIILFTSVQLVTYVVAILYIVGMCSLFQSW